MDDRTIRNREQGVAPILGMIAGGNKPSRQEATPVRTVKLVAYPTSASVFYWVQPFDVGGVETEGTAFTSTDNGSAFAAANIGSSVPALGTTVVASPIGDGRWVFSY